jgi:hypothetical protein
MERMKTTISQTITMKRHSETGDTCFKMWQARGAPNLIYIEQKLPNGSVQRIEMTEPEANFIRHTLNELENTSKWEERFEKDGDEEARQTLGLARLIR